MKKLFVLVFFVLTFAFGETAFAQNNNALLIPQVIYVGDPAVLVLPLPSGNQDAALGDIILTGISPNFPSDEKIDFHRIVLERRTAGSRLLIEFTAFAPGVLELPVIEIENERFAGLTVTVNSVLDSNGQRVLARSASTLAMPGTALMLYGTMAAIVFIVFLIIWFALKGRRFLESRIAKWKRKRLFASMRNTEKRLQKALLKDADKRYILDKLSDEFKTFLSCFMEENCRAMTAREFEKLPFDSAFDGHFLGNFFRACDELRFSGKDAGTQNISCLLGDIRSYLETLQLKLFQVKERVL